jgi:hypothetical protein
MTCTPIHSSATVITAPFVGTRANPPDPLDTGPGDLAATELVSRKVGGSRRTKEQPHAVTP